MEQAENKSSGIVARTLVFVAALYIAWVAAWLLERHLEQHVGWLSTSGERFAYWTAMKLLLWVILAVVLVRRSGRRVRDVIAIDRLRAALVWGGGAGLIIGATGILQRFFNDEPLVSISPSWALLSVLLVAPVVEEFTFRGAVLGNLTKRYRFAAANTLTALFFLVSHFPGWYFMGNLGENLAKPMGGALSIFVVGWVFGYVMHRSKSVIGCMLAHFLNNLFS